MLAFRLPTFYLYYSPLHHTYTVQIPALRIHISFGTPRFCNLSRSLKGVQAGYAPFLFPPISNRSHQFHVTSLFRYGMYNRDSLSDHRCTVILILYVLRRIHRMDSKSSVPEDATVQVWDSPTEEFLRRTVSQSADLSCLSISPIATRSLRVVGLVSESLCGHRTVKIFSWKPHFIQVH